MISIGYSACHWCHVMAHESFEDREVAEALNQGFVPVKVDREERPDVDAVYMEALQLAGGSGGWPMTVLATPDGRPFWTGTYLPKPAFLRLLHHVGDLWTSRRADIERDAAALAEALQQEAGALARAAAGTSGERAWAEALRSAGSAVLARQDREWGGTAGAPKFPQPPVLEALARCWWRNRDQDAAGALWLTLDAMSSGGIYDHLGGGFHRYSTDRRWLVPHFEKMLYDNALLLATYAHAWQLSGARRYRQVVEETAGYLLSPPLRLPEGAWAASEDADSEGVEGFFYTWRFDDMVAVGGPAAAEWYGATPAGNWEGTNVLWRPGIGEVERPPQIEEARLRLADHRDRRQRPSLDTKVVTEWNAMAMSALAVAGRVFSRPEWVAAAEATAELLEEHLRRPADGRWFRAWRPGQADTPRHLACAGDYAWLVDAFTRLGEATGKARWTEAATETAGALRERFWDKEAGGFFTAGDDGEPLVARLKELYDGAVPSANSTASLALARLGELTGEHEWEELATRTLALAAPAVQRAPAAFCWLSLAADYLAAPRRQVVVTSCAPALVRPVWERYMPDTVLAWCQPFRAPLWEGREGPEAAGQAFVCAGYRCQLPVRTPEELGLLLDQPALPWN
jgi:uncharacterized protein YyaL (SSP411 family)